MCRRFPRALLLPKRGWTRPSEESCSTWKPSCARGWTMLALRNYSTLRSPSWARALRTDLCSVFCPPCAFPLLSTAIHQFRTFHRVVFSHVPCFPPLLENPGRQDRVERQRAEDQRRFAPRNQGASFRSFARGLFIWMDGWSGNCKSHTLLQVEGFLLSHFSFHSLCVLKPEPRGIRILSIGIIATLLR